MTRDEVKVFIKKIREAGNTHLSEEDAYIIFKNCTFDETLENELSLVEAFKEENIQKWIDEGNYEKYRCNGI